MQGVGFPWGHFVNFVWGCAARTLRPLPCCPHHGRGGWGIHRLFEGPFFSHAIFNAVFVANDSDIFGAIIAAR